MTFTKQVSIDPPSDTFEICNFHFWFYWCYQIQFYYENVIFWSVRLFLKIGNEKTWICILILKKVSFFHFFKVLPLLWNSWKYIVLWSVTVWQSKYFLLWAPRKRSVKDKSVASIFTTVFLKVKLNPERYVYKVQNLETWYSGNTCCPKALIINMYL